MCNVMKQNGHTEVNKRKVGCNLHSTSSCAKLVLGFDVIGACYQHLTTKLRLGHQWSACSVTHSAHAANGLIIIVIERVTATTTLPTRSLVPFYKCVGVNTNQELATARRLLQVANGVPVDVPDTNINSSQWWVSLRDNHTHTHTRKEASDESPPSHLRQKLGLVCLGDVEVLVDEGVGASLCVKRARCGVGSCLC